MCPASTDWKFVHRGRWSPHTARLPGVDDQPRAWHDSEPRQRVRARLDRGDPAARQRTGREYPDLALTGGVDKRVLARGRKAIDEMVDRIFPAMQARGGYIPTCDHGVPEEVPYQDYLHYRKRCLEFA